jgi:Sec7-like guanine-nucleotide exchange factor
MIVLQTTMHNPNIKQKLRLKDFEMTAKSNCPKSWDNLPEDYVPVLYENVKNTEIYSPLARNWYIENFNQADLTLCKIKLSQIKNQLLLDHSEFVNTADLT